LPASTPRSLSVCANISAGIATSSKKRLDRFLPGELLGLLGGLLGVARQETLVETLLRRQSRPIAEQDVEEVQWRQVPPEYDEAHRQRCRQQQSDGAPQPGPECRRDDHRGRRQAGGPAVNPRLDQIGGDGFGGGKQQHGPEEQPPARIDRDGQRAGQDCGQRPADIGHEAHHHAEQSP